MVSELSSSPPHSWPTPAEMADMEVLSMQAVLCPSFCLFHPHLAVFDEKLRTTPKGEVRSGGEFSTSDKGSQGRHTVIYSVLTSDIVWVLLFASVRSWECRHTLLDCHQQREFFKNKLQPEGVEMLK